MRLEGSHPKVAGEGGFKNSLSVGINGHNVGVTVLPSGVCPAGMKRIVTRLSHLAASHLCG